MGTIYRILITVFATWGFVATAAAIAEVNAVTTDRVLLIMVLSVVLTLGIERRR